MDKNEKNCGKIIKGICQENLYNELEKILMNFNYNDYWLLESKIFFM